VTRQPAPEPSSSPVSERAVIDALARAIIVTTADGRIVLWNRSAEQLYGWSEEEVLGRTAMDVLVPLLDRATAEQIMSTVVSGERWDGDFSVVRRDGDTTRVYVIDTPIVDETGAVVAVVGASEDVTEQRLLEQRAADLAQHLALALDAGELGTWRWDMSTGETLWDRKLETLYGLEPGTFPGTFDAYVSMLHPDDAPSVLETVERALAERSRYTVEHRVVWRDGSVHWMQGKGQVTLDEFGNVTGTLGCVADITDQRQTAERLERAVEAEREAADSQRASADRLGFLSEMNEALAMSRTRREAMRNVARAAVPKLGDWCSVFLLTDDHSAPQVEIAHTDPSKVRWVEELHAHFGFDPDADIGIPRVIRTGQSERYDRLDEWVANRAHVGDAATELVRALGLRSAMEVPLIKRGRVVGALQLARTTESESFAEEDVLLAEIVASRVASTLENRRLDEEQRSIARTLQNSLLPPELPPIDGIDVAVRYWAFGTETIVGGDFYDVFGVSDSWAVVIGDVCGKGPLAASLTGLVRHTVRAAAWNGADGEGVLGQLNFAIQQSNVSTFCTALFCTLSARPSGFDFTVTGGGHPLPIIVRADGRSETVGVPGTLVGAFDDATWSTGATHLHPGDTIVLYTDGITDVAPSRGGAIDDVQALVQRAAAHATDAEGLATHLGQEIDSILPFEERDDDIALVVMKVR
jgi:PAS domain S-box-containing protein